MVKFLLESNYDYIIIMRLVIAIIIIILILIDLYNYLDNYSILFYIRSTIIFDV